MGKSRHTDKSERKYRGTVEHEPRSLRSNAQAVRDVIAGLTDRHTAPVFPAMSDHYRIPGAIGSVLLPHEYDAPDVHYPTQEAIDAINRGWDSEGNYHESSLRTEHIERPVQLNGSWDV